MPLSYMWQLVVFLIFFCKDAAFHSGSALNYDVDSMLIKENYSIYGLI